MVLLLNGNNYIQIVESVLFPSVKMVKNESIKFTCIKIMWLEIFINALN